MAERRAAWGNLCRFFLDFSGRPVLPPYSHALHRRFPPLLALPPFPGRQRDRICPEALAAGLGGLLDLRELALLVVLDVPPGEPLGHQLSVHVQNADMDVRDDPAVAVLVDLLDFDRVALDQVTQGLPEDVAESRLTSAASGDGSLFR